MGGGKKQKAGSRGREGKRKDGKGGPPAEEGQGGRDQDAFPAANLSAAERVQIARPFWESLSPEERTKLLQINLDELREDIAKGSSQGDALSAHLGRRLEHGLQRLEAHGTWKAWISWDELAKMVTPSSDDTAGEGQSGAGVRVFYDGEEFRKFLQSRYPRELWEMLERRDWNSKIETPAEAMLRTRMQEVLQSVHSSTVQEEGQGQGGSPVGGEKGEKGDKGDKGAGGGGGGGNPGANRGHNRPQRRSAQESAAALRSSNIELITLMLEALEQEHELLYHALLFPVTEFVCGRLPEGERESTREELFFEDLGKLDPDDVARVCEFLTEKVDSLAARNKPDPGEEEEEEEEEEGMGDIDLFQLEESSLVVNPKWLRHLQERHLGEDGHPKKVPTGEQDGKSVGLVLDWIYGSIVSTAEKSRDAARKALLDDPLPYVASPGELVDDDTLVEAAEGATLTEADEAIGKRHESPAHQVYKSLLAGLEDQLIWEQRRSRGKQLLSSMIQSRKLSAELTRQVEEARQDAPKPDPAAGTVTEVEPASSNGALPPAYLPDHVVQEMLRREDLLTSAKLFSLQFEHEVGEKKLRAIRAQLRQSEPEFERLKKELEDLKANPRGVEGSYRTQAEMERHRAQLADQAIEEQLEVQTAFREQGARLKAIYDRRQQCEMEMHQRDNEIKHLHCWKKTVGAMAARFGDLVQQGRDRSEAERDPEAPPAALPSTSPGTEIVEIGKDAEPAKDGVGEVDSDKLRKHFDREIRRQLYAEQEDRQFFAWIISVLKEVDKRIDAGYAALSHMETMVVNLACDDPGATLGGHLALPQLQRLIDQGARDLVAELAQEANAEILALEESAKARERADRERRAKRRTKQREERRARSEGERRAKEEALVRERERAEAAERERLQAETEARERKQAEMEARRRREEEVMEMRRLELLREETAAVSLGAPAPLHREAPPRGTSRDEQGQRRRKKNAGDEPALPMPVNRKAGGLAAPGKAPQAAAPVEVPARPQADVQQERAGRQGAETRAVDAQDAGVGEGSSGGEEAGRPAVVDSSKALTSGSEPAPPPASANGGTERAAGSAGPPGPQAGAPVPPPVGPGPARGPPLPRMVQPPPGAPPAGGLPFVPMSGPLPSTSGVFLPAGAQPPGPGYPFAPLPMGPGAPPPYGMPVHPMYYPGPIRGGPGVMMQPPRGMVPGMPYQKLPYQFPPGGIPQMPPAGGAAAGANGGGVRGPSPPQLRVGAQPFVPLGAPRTKGEEAKEVRGGEGRRRGMNGRGRERVQANGTAHAAKGGAANGAAGSSGSDSGSSGNGSHGRKPALPAQ